MNKKISFLILSTYLTTTIGPTMAFAQENNKELLSANNVVVDNEKDKGENGAPGSQTPQAPSGQNQEKPDEGQTPQQPGEGQTQEKPGEGQTPQGPNGQTQEKPGEETPQGPNEPNQEKPGEEIQKPEEIKLSKITVKYLDLTGREIRNADTNDTLVKGDNKGHTELFIKPAEINNKCATKVKVNGKEYSYISGIFLALDKDHEDITIEWIYEDGMPSIMNISSGALIHKTFFPEDKSTIYGNNKYVFPMNHRYNISMSSNNVEFFQSSLNNNVVKIGSVNVNSDYNEKGNWLSNVINNKHFLDVVCLTVESSSNQPAKTDMIVALTKDEYTQHFDKAKTTTIYAYKIDEKNKTLIPAGTLVTDKAVKNNSNNYVIFNGKIDNAINSKILYSTVEIDVKTNKPLQDTTVENDKENTENKDEQNKDENLNDGMHKGPFGIANAKGLGNFTITYNQYLEEVKKLNELGNNNLEESFLPINGTNGLDFYLHLSFKNLEDVFKTLKNTSDIKINLTENVNGAAKQFSDLYKDKITQTVTIESNMLHSFKANNNINVKNNGHVYLVPNTNAGKVVYLGEQTNTTKISTKADLDNMTIFVTSEKITLKTDGSLPDTSGVGPIVMVGGVALTLAGGFIVLGKRKKEHK